MVDLVTQEQIERANWIAEMLLNVRDDAPLDEIPTKTADLKTLALVYLQYRLPSLICPEGSHTGAECGTFAKK